MVYDFFFQKDKSKISPKKSVRSKFKKKRINTHTHKAPSVCVYNTVKYDGITDLIG